MILLKILVLTNINPQILKAVRTLIIIRRTSQWYTGWNVRNQRQKAQKKL